MNYGQKIMLKALTKGVVPDCEREEFDDWKFNQSSDDVIDALIEIGAAINRDSPEWVAVSEQMPTEDGYYLATVGAVGIDPDETTCHELNWFKGKWYLPNDEMIEMEPVIAWREKPKPYTEPDASDGGKK